MPTEEPTQEISEQPQGQEAEKADYQAEAEKWKSLSRKNEDRARENAEKAKRLDELEEKSKSEIQKAIEAREAAEKRASALEVKVLRASIASTKGVDADLLTGSTEEEITAAADKLLAWRGQSTPAGPPASTSSSDAGEKGDLVGQARQLTRDDLKGMTPKQINDARREGKLNQIMGITS